MITQIQFKNFKCYEDTTIKLSDLTVFTGLNGMGKSTIIQGILCLRQSYLANRFQEGLELAGKYVVLGSGKDILYEKAEEDQSIGISLVTDEDRFDYSFEYSADSTVLANSSNDNMKICNIISSEQFIYLSANRIVPRISYGIGNTTDVDKRDFDCTGEYALQYVDAHGADQNDEGIDSNLNMKIDKWIQEIAPGAHPVISVNRDMLYSDLRFEFREGNDKTRPYRAINVGFGMTYVFPVIVSLATAHKGDFIIVENPEAHIHPRGQRKLGELIAIATSRGAQVLLETHSDHVMNGIRLAVKHKVLSKEQVEFAYLYKDDVTFEHKCLYPLLDEEGQFDYWPKGFFDEWDDSLMELLSDGNSYK